MNTPEQAKQEWEKKSDIYGVKDHLYSEGFMDGIDLYQSALKEVIEKEIKFLRDIYPAVENKNGVQTEIDHWREFLKLLTTVTPKK
jgi:hypothetical protein